MNRTCITTRSNSLTGRLCSSPGCARGSTQSYCNCRPRRARETQRARTALRSSRERSQGGVRWRDRRRRAGQVEPPGQPILCIRRTPGAGAMTTRRITVVATILAFALQAAQAQSPLHIARQGSLEAGGRVIDCPTNDGSDPLSKRFPPGHVVVDNVYATYEYPVEQRSPYPILFNSGGAHTARVSDTTP